MQYLLLLPVWYQYLLVVALGLIIGSFLNVYIYRYHTGRSLSGHSHCLSCGEPLRWYELFPVISYLCLRGRCRTCGSYIPARYLLVELGTATLFAILYTQFGPSPLFLVNLILGVLLIVTAVYDLYHFIIPNEMVVSLSVTAVLLFVLQQPLLDQRALIVAGYAALAALLASAFYGLLWVVSHGRWIGFGDVKLALPFGFLLGLGGIFSFVTLSFWIGAALSLVAIGYIRARQLARSVQRRITFPQSAIEKYPVSLTMKSEVPFAPFMILAFLAVYLGHLNVLALFQLFW